MKENNINNKPNNDKDDNNKKHAIFLLIVAMCTVIIVVIGATYAYLRSLEDTSDVTNINAKTKADSSIFSVKAGDDLTILVEPEDLSDDPTYTGPVNEDDPVAIGSALTDYTYSEATFNSAGTSEVNYDVYVKVKANNFVYSSGLCYEYTAAASEANIENPTKTTCTSNGYKWVTSDGTNYKCINGLSDTWSAAGTVRPTNRLSCLLDSSNVWEKVSTPELTISLYKNVVTDSCATAGVCMASDFTIDTTNTTGTDCENAGNTWVAGIENDDKCYVLVNKTDLTEAVITDEENNEKGIALASGMTINVDPTTPVKTDYYYAVLGFENLSHNQIENGNKEFIGSLNFVVNKTTNS